MIKPYYDEDGIQIFHADCRDVLPHLNVGAADVVVCDPPFGIDFDYGTYKDSPETYPEMMRFVVSESSRIVNGGACFFWQGMPNAPKWHQWFPSDFRIFAACKGFVQYRPTPIQFSFDPVIFFGALKGRPSVYRKDFHIQTLAPFGANRPKINHPCPRPLEQVKYVVSIAAEKGDTVLDPFMGSGTTLVAAKAFGLKAIGIEIEEKYCQIAVERLRQRVFNFAEVANA